MFTGVGIRRWGHRSRRIGSMAINTPEGARRYHRRRMRRVLSYVADSRWAQHRDGHPDGKRVDTWPRRGKATLRDC